MHVECSGVNLKAETDPDIYNHLLTLGSIISGCCKFVEGHHLCLLKIYDKGGRRICLKILRIYLFLHRFKPSIIYLTLETGCACNLPHLHAVTTEHQSRCLTVQNSFFTYSFYLIGHYFTFL